MLDNGDKHGAYGYVAQLFGGTELSEVSSLVEESFKVNVEQLVRVMLVTSCMYGKSMLYVYHTQVLAPIHILFHVL